MRPSSASSTRRSFLKTVAASSTAAALAAGQESDQILAEALSGSHERGPNDRVRIATIGMGIIGFIDTETALKVPGVELVAAADLYDGRRVHVKEVFGDHVVTTNDYRAILDRKDVDAVLICVPDHWHARISIDAMRAGKAVYCEKPMVRLVEEGPEVIAVQKQTGAVFQVGSQYASSLIYDKTRDLIKAGAIGKINAVEARYNRNTALGAWQYSIPTDASPQTVDWDRFLGSAPKREFDSVRFFRWRNYSDYGTAVAGDLFVHLLTGIHHAVGSLGPTRVAAMGGRRYWNDGRNVYDCIMALLDYPETDAHPGFTLGLQSNFEDGGGRNTYFRFIGSEGMINVSFTELTLNRTGIPKNTVEERIKGYNSVKTFSKAQQAILAEKYAKEDAGQPAPVPAKEGESFRVPKGYDERLVHFTRFFESIRQAIPVYEDALFGFRAAAPALLCNQSQAEGKVIGWDPAGMKVV